MEEIKFKELAPYLPYNIKLQLETTGIWYGNMIGLTPCIDNKYFKVQTDFFSIDNKMSWGLNCYVKPILRPLSDLTKQLKGFEGNMFSWSFYNSEEDLYNAILKKEIPLSLYELLLKWHFDIFRLIEKGLAININTLKNERKK